MSAHAPRVAKDYPEFAGGRESFVADFRIALADALRAKDDRGYAVLNRLWLDNFENGLGKMRPARLKRYLESRQVWKRTPARAGSRPVYKAGEEPCIVFSADSYADGSIDLIAIGACYRFPGGENAWWTNVIEPRAMTL